MSATESPTTAVQAVVGRWAGRFDRLLVVLGGVAAVVVLVVVGVTLLTSVALRYVSGSSLGFATELPSYLFPWLVCGGIVAAAGAGGHLAVDFFVNKLPAPVHRAVTTVMWVLVVVTFVATTQAALRLVDAFAGQATPILGWPAVGSYLAFPIALAALAAHSAVRAVVALVGVSTASGSPLGEGTFEEVVP